MKRYDLKNAFPPIPEDCYQALMTAAHSVKEEPVVKKKITAAVILVVALVLILGVALAVISMQTTGRDVLETEQTSGDYGQWPLESKVSLVSALVELKYVDETAEVKQLLAGELTGGAANRAADAVLADFTGLDVSEVCFMTIMEAAWGPFENWSTEEQAWYSSLMVDMGIQREGITQYVTPEGDMDEAAAVATARTAIAKGFGVEESALDAYTLETSFQIPEFAEEGDTQAYWCVSYMRPQDMPGDEALFEEFTVFIQPKTGAFYQTVDEIIAERKEQQDLQTAIQNDPLLSEMRAYAQEHQLPASPYRWTLDELAQWSETFRERGLKKLAEHPEYFGDMTAAMLAYVYGLPDEKAIPQEKALSIAEDAIVTRIGRKAEEVPFFTHGYAVFYDVTDPETPLWKFFFRMPNEYDSDTAYARKVKDYYGENGERLPNIKVEMNAYTGEVTAAFTIDFGDFGYAEGDNNKGAEGYLKVF